MILQTFTVTSSIGYVVLCIAVFRLSKGQLSGRHLGIFEIDTFCVITLNFVEIGRTVAEISHFFVFFK